MIYEPFPVEETPCPECDWLVRIPVPFGPRKAVHVMCVRCRYSWAYIRRLQRDYPLRVMVGEIPPMGDREWEAAAASGWTPEGTAIGAHKGRDEPREQCEGGHLKPDFAGFTLSELAGAQKALEIMVNIVVEDHSRMLLCCALVYVAEARRLLVGGDTDG